MMKQWHTPVIVLLATALGTMWFYWQVEQQQRIDQLEAWRIEHAKEHTTTGPSVWRSPYSGR